MINDNINPISQRTVPVKSVLFAIAFAILSGGLANSQIDDSTPPPLNKEGMGQVQSRKFLKLVATAKSLPRTN
jgi:hypothetical protein